MFVTMKQSNYVILFQASSGEDFGNNWETGTRECVEDPGPIDPCDLDSPTFTLAENLCYYLIDEYGKFIGIYVFWDLGNFLSIPVKPFYEIYHCCQ